MNVADMTDTHAAWQQIQRFDAAPTPSAPSLPPGDDVESLIARAEATLTKVLERGMPVCVSWSAGKDSSCVLNLLLSAASKMADAGRKTPPIVVTHADTLVESPAMVEYARAEMDGVRAFAKEHNLDVSIEISEPHLADTWAVRIIGGRALPPFPGTNRDCSTSWKVLPMQRLRKKVLKRLQEHCATGEELEPVVLLGTRYDESSTRAANMAERGESDTEIRRGVDEKGKASHLFLSPICWWSTDNVWEYLGMARAKAIPAYSNFEETFRVYADSMNTTCVIVAEDMSKSMKSSKACGARTGCWSCTAVGKDQSMENMLEKDDRYAYMRGLNQLRNFISNTRWDAERRSWLGRTINDNHIRIAPDAYSPAMMEELLRYSLTLDVQEQERARTAGEKPKFQIISLESLIAIDAMWSLQAYHRPFHALSIYDEVYQQGKRFPVPEVSVYPRWKEQKPLYFNVGPDWDEGHDWDCTGLRNIVLEAVRHDGDGCMGNRTLSNGKSVLGINTDEVFSVDPESAALILELELPDLLREHAATPKPSTAGYMYYVGMGTIAVRSGKESEIDEILRRSAFKFRHDLAGQVDHRQLVAMAVTAEQAGLTETVNGKTRKRGAAGSKSVLVTDLDMASSDEPQDEMPMALDAGGETARPARALP
jgi:3'-phosphoadenosine 5'-phosphosulfate sulfotransferase (PAPS reductase)/FAD synthetase